VSEIIGCPACDPFDAFVNSVSQIMGVVKRCGALILELHQVSRCCSSMAYQSKILLKTGSLANTVIRKSMGLFEPVNMFHLLLLSAGLTQALNSLRSRKKSDHNAVKFSYELNFRHSRFNSYLFTIHSQGLLHFTPHEIHFNHDSRNSFFMKSQFTEHKKTGSRCHENTLALPSYGHSRHQPPNHPNSALCTKTEGNLFSTTI